VPIGEVAVKIIYFLKEDVFFNRKGRQGGTKNAKTLRLFWFLAETQSRKEVDAETLRFVVIISLIS
jgi:hypothetical protein